ncbi:MAG: spermidine/putrescine ABC transporter substrate-binding protein [Clostridia bacterium]|nr:spermidine/putrescine ABC transporter substrate-binding protein [Clostridia bacterium]
MKRFVALLLLSLLLLSATPLSFATESGFDIDYSDTVDWNKFRGQGITLNVYNWGEYISVDDGEDGAFDTVAEFEKLTGIDVVYSTFSTNEELYAKLKMGGGSQYDVIIPSDYMVSRMINEGMLAKLNYDNIPNAKYIREDLRVATSSLAAEYSVPYLWGIVGIIYNTTLVDPEDDVHTWDILWNEKYANNILMFQNSRDTVGIALKRLGYSFNTTNEEEIRSAAHTLVDQKPIVQAYVMDEIFDKMIGGEAALAPYYAGDAIVMMQDNPDLAFAVPVEGTNLFIDSMCIPANSKNKEAAELFINYMCETLVALKNTEYVGYATPHTEAFTYLDEEMQTSVTYPDDEVLKKAEAFTALPPATTSLLDSLWTDILSSGVSSPWMTPVFMGICIALTIGINAFKKQKKKRTSF